VIVPLSNAEKSTTALPIRLHVQVLADEDAGMTTVMHVDTCAHGVDTRQEDEPICSS
jgi:hypothetical protein